MYTIGGWFSGARRTVLLPNWGRAGEGERAGWGARNPSRGTRCSGKIGESDCRPRWRHAPLSPVVRCTLGLVGSQLDPIKDKDMNK